MRRAARGRARGTARRTALAPRRRFSAASLTFSAAFRGRPGGHQAWGPPRRTGRTELIGKGKEAGKVFWRRVGAAGCRVAATEGEE